MTIDEIARDPTLLLHRVDPVRRQLDFRPTSPEAVRDAAFIDGRTEIWSGPPVVVSFDEASAAPPQSPLRLVFHMSFCGSTLLARLLDRPGKALALKEPNCLVDLANWKTQSGGADFDPILKFALAMLARPWAEGEQVVIKPSSWVNNLIDDLLAGPAPVRALFVTIARDRFLEAVLRGGGERIAFAARLAAHLFSFLSDGPEKLQAAIDSTPDPIAKAARLALVAHDLELRLFEWAIGRLAVAEVVDFDDIESQPSEAASRAVEALQLGLDAEDIESNVDRWARANAKADAAFSAEQRRAENEQVHAAYGAVIDSVLAWAEQALGPATLQPS